MKQREIQDALCMHVANPNSNDKAFTQLLRMTQMHEELEEMI